MNQGRAMRSTLVEHSSSASSSTNRERFANLRGVRWRIDLGVLPSSRAASIDDLRRVTADARRGYANLRRRILVDHQLPKDGDSTPHPTIDNPLSLNPDSSWGRFFKNAELGKVVDQDLSMLYPENSGCFHTPQCQAMLKRILLLWCLQHPDHGYHQGMHELLAPLVYVLHADLDYLVQLQKHYEDYFNDEFDGTSLPESDQSRRVRNWDFGIETNDNNQEMSVGSAVDQLDPDTRDIFALSDSYGAEGELGVVLSKRFMEHDAYCMFENLMDGSDGVVAMESFYSPVVESSPNLPPVIEVSSSIYHLLSIVDSSLHSHLVELEVEPQYFALRWLRVLFGREFRLDNLLVIWDKFFSSSNSRCIDSDVGYKFKVLCSPRGALIVAFAVSMLLYLRSSLLAAETATICLQRLLNFPLNPDKSKLIEKARSLHHLALESNVLSSSSQRDLNNNALTVSRRFSSLPPVSALVMISPNAIPESYWEEKWRVFYKDEELQKQNYGDLSSGGMVKENLTDKLSLSRTPPEPIERKHVHKLSALGRELFDEASNGIETIKDDVTSRCDVPPTVSSANAGEDCPAELEDQRTSNCILETFLSASNSLEFSKSTNPPDVGIDHENESEKSIVTSNSFLGDSNEETINSEELCSQALSSGLAQDAEATSSTVDSVPEQLAAPKDWKSFATKFQWLWKFGRVSNQGNQEPQQSSTAGFMETDSIDSITCDKTTNSHRVDSTIEVRDKKVMGALRSLGQSMLENIQVIEAVFQLEKGRFDSLDSFSNNILRVKGQNTATLALKELRKISNLLQEM